MPANKPVDPAVSMNDPRSIFDTPDAVLKSALSADEKHSVLMDWLEDEKALLRAASEGMAGGERPMVQRVERALEQLESQRS